MKCNALPLHTSHSKQRAVRRELNEGGKTAEMVNAQSAYLPGTTVTPTEVTTATSAHGLIYHGNIFGRQISCGSATKLLSDVPESDALSALGPFSPAILCMHSSTAAA